jgi:hypothetical protein
MNNKILHVAGYSTFMLPFLNMLHSYFEHDKHALIVAPSPNKVNLPQVIRIEEYEYNIKGRIKYSLELVIEMHKAEKIIIHGLFDLKTLVILFFMPWLLKKSYWVIWGGDLYAYQLEESNWKRKIIGLFRRPVIKNMGHLVTYIKGDVDLARKWYGAKGEYHECLMYLSNTYKTLDVPNTQSDKINIQIGNSADPSNNHIEILDKLLPFKDKNIRIYAPLSYGDKAYAKEVIAKGKELFGDKFIALTEFMPFEQYLQFLGSIDIAIFNHKRQQAMGNTITLLGLGKTVFIRSDTTQWQLFKDKNIEVLNTLSFELNYIKDLERNIKNTADYFSKETLIEQYKLLFK